MRANSSLVCVCVCQLARLNVCFLDCARVCMSMALVATACMSVCVRVVVTTSKARVFIYSCSFICEACIVCSRLSPRHSKQQ